MKNSKKYLFNQATKNVQLIEGNDIIFDCQSILICKWKTQKSLKKQSLNISKLDISQKSFTILSICNNSFWGYAVF